MEERFFCAKCNDARHILGVERVGTGLQLTEYKFEKIACNGFTIPSSKFDDLKQILDENIELAKPTGSLISLGGKEENKDKKSKKVDFSL